MPPVWWKAQRVSKLQKILLAILIPVMVALIVITWGSIFSIILAATMFLIPVIYLANRFINTDEGSDFTDDGNG